MSIADELALLANTKEKLRVALLLDKSVPFSQYVDQVPFSPRSLFMSGEQGVWYDPSDISTLFQDAAGTIPVMADGDPVGLMLDKSGNDNPATQTVLAARPVYRTDGTLRWLEFDGVDDFMTVDGYKPPLLSAFHTSVVFSIARIPTIGEGGVWSQYTAGTGRLIVRAGPASQNTSLDLFFNGQIGSPLLDLLHNDTLAVSRGDAGFEATNSLAASFLSDKSTPIANAPLRLGSSTGVSGFLNGSCYGFTSVDKTLDNSQKSALRKYHDAQRGA